jgi:hypothetical protein
MANSLESIGAAKPSSLRGSRGIASGHGPAVSTFLVLLAMFLALLAEYRRASAAAHRYDALKYRARDDAGADIPRQVFDEFYSR